MFEEGTVGNCYEKKVDEKIDEQITAWEEHIKTDNKERFGSVGQNRQVRKNRAATTLNQGKKSVSTQKKKPSAQQKRWKSDYEHDVCSLDCGELLEKPR